MKKLVSIILTLAIALAGITAIAENDEIKVYVDGKQIEFDVQPIIENDVTLVPMRAIFEALNCEVDYNEFKPTDGVLGDILKRVSAKKTYDDGTDKISEQIAIYIGQTRMEKSTAKHDYIYIADTIELDVPAQIVNDRTLVPLRVISEAFDYDVQWDGDTKTVTITSDETPQPKTDTYTQKLMSNLPQDENYVVSPLSLKMAMMMAANGADGETQKEILDTFGIENIGVFNDSAKELIKRLNSSENGEVNIANSIWFNKDYYGIQDVDFADGFKNIIADNYSGNAEAVTNKDSVERVNEWVSEQTKGKITNLLSEENRNYLAALVNTVYMKADWINSFTEEATYKEIFTDINGGKNEIDFMHQTDRFKYYENGDTKIVCMPYKNGLSMYVVLGDTKNFESDINNMSVKKVNLSIPKFKTEYSAILNGILGNMGINKAFEDNNNDFDAMLQNAPEPIKIETVLQKAIIEVDEKGTEAAAATAVMMTGSAAALQPEKIVEFKADEPFTYYILDDASEEILFAGRYVKCE